MSLDVVADKLIVSHRLLDEAGLGYEENLLELTTRLHLLMRQLHRLAEPRNIPLTCAEYFGTYVAARREGMSPDDASKGLLEFMRVLLTVE